MLSQLGDTALMLAIESSRIEFGVKLMKVGADLHIQNKVTSEQRNTFFYFLKKNWIEM